MSNQEQDLVSSLKYQAALKCAREDLPLSELPNELVDYCEELDFSEKMKLVNTLKPPVFDENSGDELQPPYSVCCSDLCTLPNGPCIINTTLDPLKDLLIPTRFRKPGNCGIGLAFDLGMFTGWISKFRLVHIDNVTHETRFINIWELGIKQIQIEEGERIINVVPGELLKLLAMEYKLKPGELPLLLESNSGDHLFLSPPRTFRYLFIVFEELIHDVQLLVTHSYHRLNLRAFNIDIGSSRCKCLMIDNQGSTNGATKLVISNEEMPTNRRFTIKDLAFKGKAIHFTIPKNRMKIFENFTIIDVDNFTADILADNIWYIHRNEIKYENGRFSGSILNGWETFQMDEYRWRYKNHMIEQHIKFRENWKRLEAERKANEISAW